MVKAGFLLDEDLNEAKEIAKGSNQRIGRVLVMSGFVTEVQLALAQAIHEKLNDGRISLDEAIKSLRATDTSKR